MTLAMRINDNDESNGDDGGGENAEARVRDDGGASNRKDGNRI